MACAGVKGFWWGNLMEGDHLEDQDADVRNVLKLMLKKQKGSVVDWINLA